MLTNPLMKRSIEAVIYLAVLFFRERFGYLYICNNHNNKCKNNNTAIIKGENKYEKNKYVKRKQTRKNYAKEEKHCIKS